MTGWHWLLVGLGATLAVYAALLVALALGGRRGDARALASFIPDCLVLLHVLLRDPRVPRRRKLLLAALVREHWRGPQRSLDALLRLA
jgi:hypothetical protein